MYRWIPFRVRENRAETDTDTDTRPKTQPIPIQDRNETETEMHSVLFVSLPFRLFRISYH